MPNRKQFIQTAGILAAGMLIDIKPLRAAGRLESNRPPA